MNDDKSCMNELKSSGPSIESSRTRVMMFFIVLALLLLGRFVYYTLNSVNLFTTDKLYVLLKARGDLWYQKFLRDP